MSIVYFSRQIIILFKINNIKSILQLQNKTVKDKIDAYFFLDLPKQLYTGKLEVQIKILK